MITIVIAAIMGYVNLGILCGLGAYYEERSKLAGWLVRPFSSRRYWGPEPNIPDAPRPGSAASDFERETK